jgi:hypothetical protein
MDLYHLRQGLHVIASSWDYHGGAESRVSVRGNSVRFMIPARGREREDFFPRERGRGRGAGQFCSFGEQNVSVIPDGDSPVVIPNNDVEVVGKLCDKFCCLRPLKVRSG